MISRAVLPILLLLGLASSQLALKWKQHHVKNISGSTVAENRQQQFLTEPMNKHQKTGKLAQITRRYTPMF